MDSNEPAQQPLIAAAQKYCTACGSVAFPVLRREGSRGIEILSWLTFIVPGIIYSIWRSSTRKSVCPSCGSSAIIPLDSPRAKAALGSSIPEMAAGGGETERPQAGEKQTRAATKGKLLLGAVLALALVSGLYFVNRYWIVPALQTQAMSSGDHPDAPAISLTDIEGKRLELAAYKGKVVVLDFWATWCGPCRIEIPGLIEMQDKYAHQGFSVIGISMDDEPGPVVEFYKEFKMNYPVAVGNPRIGELYGGILGLPTTFLIGRDGRIYARHVGATDVSVIEDEVQQLLAMSPTAENMDFKPGLAAGTSTNIELGDPAAIDSEIPGLNLTKLTLTQKEALKKVLTELHCPCGCNLTVLKCRQVDRPCIISLRIAKEQMEKILKSR